MIIDTTQTKIEQQMIDAQRYTIRLFKNSHGFLFGHISCNDIHVSNAMDELAAGESNN